MSISKKQSLCGDRNRKVEVDTVLNEADECHGLFLLL